MHAGVLTVDRESDVYRLRHVLLREAVYGDLVPGERGYTPPMLAC